MKNFTVLHLLLFLLLMLMYQCSHAQDLVVTITGDTLQGKIKQLSYGVDQKVQVTTADKKKHVFNVFQVRYYIEDGQKFQPVKNVDKYVFMKMIKEGYLSLLAFKADNQPTYSEYFFLKRDGSGLAIPNLSFKKQVTRYLSDVPAVADKIESGELGKLELEQIVDAYNQTIVANSNATAAVVAQQNEVSKKVSPWETLEKKVQAKEFEGKNDALDMITDIKGKVSRSEKVPKFLIDGLKGALASAELTAEVEEAIKSLTP